MVSGTTEHVCSQIVGPHRAVWSARSPSRLREEIARLARCELGRYSSLIPALDNLLSATPKLHPEAGLQRVDGRLLAAGPDDFLHTFEDEDGQVSEVAERIVELADGSRTVAQIVDALCVEFEVDPKRCTADTLEFLTLLVKRQLLVLA